MPSVGFVPKAEVASVENQQLIKSGVARLYRAAPHRSVRRRSKPEWKSSLLKEFVDSIFDCIDWILNGFSQVVVLAKAHSIENAASNLIENAVIAAKRLTREDFANIDMRHVFR